MGVRGSRWLITKTKTIITSYTKFLMCFVVRWNILNLAEVNI